jgi:hypothetical protein
MQSERYVRELLEGSDREKILAWLQWNDPNGSWTDDARRDEVGFEPEDAATLQEAKAAMMEQLEDYATDYPWLAEMIAASGARQNPGAARVTGKITLERLAGMLGLPHLDQVLERNADYIAEGGRQAEQAAIDEDQGASADASTAFEDGEHAAEAELVDQWSDGVLAAAEPIFFAHELDLEPVKPRNKRDRVWEYKIVPRTSWEAAARKIITTINGVGMFHFDSVRDFIEGGSCSGPKDAVLSHLGHLRSYPDVYGTQSPSRLFEQGFRRNPGTPGRCDKCKKSAVAQDTCPKCPATYQRCDEHGAAAGVKRSLHSHGALFHPKHTSYASDAEFRRAARYTDMDDYIARNCPHGGRADCRVCLERRQNPRDELEKIAIEYGAVVNGFKDHGWLPFLWVNDRPKGDSYASRGYDYEEAVAMAKAEADEYASRYVGDGWDVSVARRPAEREADIRYRRNPVRKLQPQPATATGERLLDRDGNVWVAVAPGSPLLEDADSGERMSRVRIEASRGPLRPEPTGNPADSEISEAMARALWVTAYADFIDEQRSEGKSRRQLEAEGFSTCGGGDDWMDVAPETPPQGLQAGRDLAALYEEVNGTSLDELAAAAAVADGQDVDGEEFGHYLAMMALGRGVSWFDDHAEFPLKTPFAFESHFDGEDFNWSGSATGGTSLDALQELGHGVSVAKFATRDAAWARARVRRGAAGRPGSPVLTDHSVRYYEGRPRRPPKRPSGELLPLDGRAGRHRRRGAARAPPGARSPPLEAQGRGNQWARLWQALQAVAIAGIPIAGFLGIRGGWFKGGK